MKKIILLTSVIVMMYAASAFAGPGTGVTTTIANGFVAGFNLSKNVHAAYQSTISATPTYYTMATKHDSGDTVFSGISTDTAMYKKPGTAGTGIATGDLPTIPTASTDRVGAGWTAM